MSTNKKRVLAALLFLGSLAVWVPQIVGQKSAGGPIDDLDPESSVFLGTLPGSEAEPLPIDLVGGSPPAPAAGSEASEPAPTESEAIPLPFAGRNFAPEPREELLERLAQAFGGLQPADAAPTGTPGLFDARDARRARADEALDLFLASNPLSGILHGPEQGVAILGSRLVRAGDELVPGELRVTLVARRHVELRAGDRSLRLELPPVAAAPRPGATAPLPTHPDGAAGTPHDGDQQP